MRMILDNPVLAMNVKVKVFLPKLLAFRHSYDPKKPNLLTQDIGNITSDSDVTYEFGKKYFYLANFHRCRGW